MNDFNDFGLQKVVLQALDKLGFTKPTPIQEQSIPLAMEGRDILGTAGTGTGKTGAFGLPLISHIMKNPEDIGLVMLPTRELAVQVMNSLRDFIGVDRSFRPALLIGGQEIRRQLNQLKYEPRLIVGTPGRIADHIKRRKIATENIKFLVLDEMDRMLDMGFGKQIDAIVRHLPKQRQTLLFSATLPNDIIKLTDKYLINPERVSVGSVTEPAKNIKQETLYLAKNECYDALVEQVAKREGSIIIFVNTKSYADIIAKRLKELGHKTASLHGDLKHTQRARVINAFRHEEVRILVATDIAARGLDIPHIEHVINYDLPNVPEDYIHRIGRTGRAEKQGEAVNLVTPADNRRWRAICQLITPDDVKTLLEMEEAEHSIGQSSDEKRGRGRRRPSFKDRKPDGRRSEARKPRAPRREERSENGEYKKPSYSKSNDDRKFSRSKPREDSRDNKRSFARKEFANDDGFSSRRGDDSGFERKSFKKPAFRDNNRVEEFSSDDGVKRNGKSRMGKKRQIEHIEELVIFEEPKKSKFKPSKSNGKDAKNSKYLARKGAKPAHNAKTSHSAKPSRAERTRKNLQDSGSAKSDISFKRVKRAK